jgi:branched-chain amino acid transport system permease protein
MSGYLSLVLELAPLFLINIILAASLNVINGFCGLFSLGHAGFFAVGAYASAAFTVLFAPEFAVSSPFLALVAACLIGMAAAAVAGLIVGIPCLRLTGDYLAVATVGFGEIIRIVLLNMESVGASRGLPGIPKLTSLPFALGATVFTLWILNNLIKSSFGRSILAVREDEIAARSMRVDVRFYKTLAFVTGSLFAGLAGALFAHFQQFIAPASFGFMVSVQILLMIVVGGLGSQRGAIIGAFLVTALPEVLRLHPALAEIRMLVFGIVMVLIMLWKPDGLIGLLKNLGRKRTEAEHAHA